MAKYFGKTWWGEKWLNALTNIDHANRIPRGASYAKAGKVKKIEIKGNQITATVLGTLNYFVKISVPEFDEDKFEVFMKKLGEKQTIISKLLNRELDPEILEIANNVGLKVFPEKWKDFKMHCDCPDIAVPCKHLAAVIYVISREIDTNPFLVFNIHGIDLIEELKKRGFSIDSSDIIEVPDVKLLLEKPQKKESKSVDSNYNFLRVDFSLIADNIQSICNILPCDTPFYQSSNFIKKYESEISRVAKSVKKILDKKSDFIESIYIKDENKIIDKDTAFKLEIDKDCNAKLLEVETGQLWNPEDFLWQILTIPPDYLEDYHPTVFALNQLVLCSLYILSSGNFAPAIFKYSNKKYFAKFFAVRIDKAVGNVISDLEYNMPDGFITAQTGKTSKFTEVKESVGLSVSWLLDFFVKNFAKPDKNDKILCFLFGFIQETFNQAGEKEIPASIKAWFDTLFFDTHQYSFKIIVNEAEQSHFNIDIAVNIKKTDVTLHDILTLPKYDGIKFKVLKEISRTASFLEGCQNYINQDAQKPLIYNLEQLTHFLYSVAPSLRLLGVEILLPKSLQNIARPKVSLKIVGKQNNSKSYIRLDELLDFDWQVALGDNLVSFEQFLKLSDAANGLIKIKQNYFYINSSDIERIKKNLESKAKLSSAQILQSALCESYDGAPIQIDENVKKIVNKLRSQPEITVPQNINASLRPYQQRGFNWLCKNYQLGFGSILADDMGLGKTLQTITFLQKLKNDGVFKNKKVLVVVPTGLVSNWLSEFEKFSPEISVFTYHGHDRDIKKFNSDIMLTTYGLMRLDVEKIKKIKWAVMIIDEAQNIKNQASAQSKAVISVSADVRVALSGTPVENRLSEFWSIMNFVNSGYLGSAKRFSETYANPIQNLGDKTRAEKLKKITAPFMMRRLKTDKSIISDLPDKIEQNEYVQLTASQAAIYQQTVEEALNEIKGVNAVNQQSLFKRQGLILQMILALKQICNHPALFLKNSDHGASLSGKSEILLSLVESIIQNGQKALIFTQFKEMGEMLWKMIADATGRKPLFLHGGCTLEQRKVMIEKFQNQKQYHIFILTLKAAGTGLNLTAANHVIHYDLWWNPAVEAQATDRAYRIGQHQNVVVHRFITKNTFEEKIDKMIQDKKQLAEMTVATGESWIGKLSDKELENLV